MNFFFECFHRIWFFFFRGNVPPSGGQESGEFVPITVDEHFPDFESVGGLKDHITEIKERGPL